MSHTASEGRRFAETGGAHGPHVALLHVAMLLSGFGTVFLGPALPALAAVAHVTDSGSGLFFTAQFAGAFMGGITTSQRLWLCLIRGLGAAAFGFAALTACTWHGAPVSYHLAALLPLGFGVGQTLTSVNLLTAKRFQQERTSALALVNFSWSLGAVTAPFLLGLALTAASITVVLFAATSVFFFVFMTTLLSGRGHTLSRDAATDRAADSLPARAFLLFAGMLLLYGGVETCLSGWITTFATRFGGATLRTGSLGATALWIGLTAGRALTPALLRVLRDRALLPAALLVSTAVVLLLSRANGAMEITALAALLGLSLAPWFPLVLSAMLSRGASARQTGIIIALSGIGAAVLPAVLGAVSSQTGSLRLALSVPAAGLVLLLLLASLMLSDGSAKSV